MPILYQSCDDINVYGYPLCRLLRKYKFHLKEKKIFIFIVN